MHSTSQACNLRPSSYAAKMVLHPCPIMKVGCKRTTHDAVCSNCLAAASVTPKQEDFLVVTCWNCRQDGHLAYDCTSAWHWEPKRRRIGDVAAATGTADLAATGSGDGLPTVVPRWQRSGEVCRLNRQQKRLHLQTPARLARLDIVATVAASRAGGFYFTADDVKAYKNLLEQEDLQELNNFLEQENNKPKETLKSEPASQQKPASKQQSPESTLRQKEKARAHKAAVESLRVLEVKQEIVDAQDKEGSSYDEIADYIELMRAVDSTTWNDVSDDPEI